MKTLQGKEQKSIGVWRPSEGQDSSLLHLQESIEALHQVRDPIFVLSTDEGIRLTRSGSGVIGPHTVKDSPLPFDKNQQSLIGYIPAVNPLDLGSRNFCQTYNIKYPYIAGAMAKGITSVKMVESLANEGLLGIFGSAGLPLDVVEEAIIQLKHRLGTKPFGVNLIHSPQEPELEEQLVALYLKHQVRLISASAYMRLTPALIYYSCKGIHKNDQGEIIRPNRIIGKVSRIEVASRFFAPASETILQTLVTQGKITPAEAELARLVPVAQDLTAEADSGGHTDNRPAITILPTFHSLREEAIKIFDNKYDFRIGLGGGIATPTSALAAFSMGADYLVTGSINQACIESGTSDSVRETLAEVSQADTTMAPAADMFEMGVNVQVVKRGTMFPIQAKKLYQLYKTYASFEDIPPKQRAFIEEKIFRQPAEAVWQQTQSFFTTRNPRELEKADKNPQYKMALMFRSYLGQASVWANKGVPDRKVDYQIWCGPAMGAFNHWTKNSFLASVENRKVVTLAYNLIWGAAVLHRINNLRAQGITLPAALSTTRPMPLEEIKQKLTASARI